LGTKKIRMNLQTDSWSRSTYQQTDGIRPNGTGEGGPGRSKHSKKATGYTNQVINMLRWMIKKSLKLVGFAEKTDSEQALKPSPPLPYSVLKEKGKT